VESNHELKPVAPVTVVQDIAKNNHVTGHCWQADADFIVSCTANGHIIVTNIFDQAQKLSFPKQEFVKL
jgi:hypothetical protein